LVNKNLGSTDLPDEDHGTGKPVVLAHGWPLTGLSGEKQVPVLLDVDSRVITCDHRGFGDSSQPTSGYHDDSFAEDPHTLVTKLNLRDAVCSAFRWVGATWLADWKPTAPSGARKTAFDAVKEGDSIAGTDLFVPAPGQARRCAILAEAGYALEDWQGFHVPGAPMGESPWEKPAWGGMRGVVCAHSV
jgi:pimeloyl-ACP methyl ester carboxylesterase